MSNKMDIKELIKTGVILFLITALSAALLAFVNGKTAPLIEKNSLEKEQNAMNSVMPEAKEFEEAEIPDGVENVNKAYMAYGENKELLGACIVTETTGYDKGIQTVTGVSADLKVTGIEITAMNETPGLGAKASEESFRDQYRDKSGNIGVSKTAADDKNIQAISGATKTSNGVTDGVNMALKTAEILFEGGNK